MRIVFITPEVPYPLTTGFLRQYHFLRFLGERHAVTHLSLTRKRGISEDALAALRPFVAHMSVFGIPTSGRPALAHSRIARAVRIRLAVRELRSALHELVSADPPDVVFLSGRKTFAAVEDLDGVPIVIDCSDAVAPRVWGELRRADATAKPWLLLRYAHVRRIERKLVRKTPYLAFISERDRRALVGASAVGEIVPNAVDVDYWRRRAGDGDGRTILFTGVMSFPPNHDAALFLLERVLPLVREAVPDARLEIAGRDPLPALVGAAGRSRGVTVTGELPDLRPSYERAAVFCAPLRFASGMQNKLLEALAMELASVTTPVAAEGLAVDGARPPLVITAGERETADAVVRLLRQPDERRRIAAEGRRFVERTFVWSRSGERIEALLRQAAGAEEPPGR